MFRKIFIFILLFMIPLIVSADDFSIDVEFDRKIYQADDTLEIKVKLTNNTSREFKGSLLSSHYPDNVDYFPMPGNKIIVIPPLSFVDLNYSLKILEDFKNGNWKYSFVLKDDNSGNIVSKKIESFEIRGNKNKLDAEFLICSENECNNKNIFKKNELVFFKVDSDISDLNIRATVGKTKKDYEDEINFYQNKADFKFKDSGEYFIYFSIEKEGYFSKKGKKEIYIIDKPIKIKNASVCDGDSVCEFGENRDNCPQDCFSKLSFFDTLKKNRILIFLVIIIGLVVVTVIFRKKSWIKYGWLNLSRKNK